MCYEFDDFCIDPYEYHPNEGWESDDSGYPELGVNDGFPPFEDDVDDRFPDPYQGWFDEGVDAYSLGKGEEDNPYAGGEPESLWNEGFRWAAKHDAAIQ